MYKDANDAASRISKEFEALFEGYSAASSEDVLQRAYELGRRAMSEGLGAVDMARLHYRALAAVPALTSENCVRGALEISERIFIESMTPYEMAHRGFREANAALRASEARYRELFENANDIVFTVDLEGRFTSINRAGERLSGYDRREILTTRFNDVVDHASVRAAIAAREKKLSGEEEFTRYELDLLTKDGQRLPLEVNTRLIRHDGETVGVQGIARDITDRKQAEQALRRLNVGLEEEARRIAHALHDQAGQLLASAHLAIAEVARELPPDAREALRRISTPLDQLAEQLRHLSHELRPILLDDFGLEAALDLLGQGISQRGALAVTIDCSLGSRLPSAMEILLYRILQEALTNASKHAQARQITVTIQRDERTLKCAVVDDGIGFDLPATIAGKGKSCLGLIGIRERLAALGGSLSIVTGPSIGTTLNMSVPLTASREDAPAVPASMTDRAVTS
jgi:two-component system, NarL family, sensor histidine kinase UhpB